METWRRRDLSFVRSRSRDEVASSYGGRQHVKFAKVENMRRLKTYLIGEHHEGIAFAFTSRV